MTTAGGVEAADVFLRAIDLEIEAVLTGSATDVTPLHHGTRTGTDGNDFEYVFQTRSKPNLARRSLIRSSTSRGRWERATAAVLPNGKVRVTTSAELGRESVRAQLREDATAPLEQLAERAAEELAQRSTQLSARLDAVRANIVLHDRLAAAERRLEALSAGRDALERRAADADAAMSRSSEQAQAVQQERVRIGSPGLLFAQRKQRRIDDLEADIVALRRAAERARVDRDRALAELPSGRLKQQSATEDLRRCRDLLTGVEALDRLRHMEQRLREDLARVEKSRREVANAVRARCRVLGTTVQKAVQSRALMDPVDVVVIDEAGMVALPWAWCAAGLSGKRVVVTGDFRQLPAVTYGSDNRSAAAADRQHSRLWMDRDAFTAAGLVAAGGRMRSDARMVRLDTQYRMRPAICAVVNEVAYPDAPLHTGRGDSAALPGSALLPSPLVLVDTSSRRMRVGRRAAGHLSNAVHEAVIHELIRGLQHDRVLPTRKAPDTSSTALMAVITPYRDQATVLQKSVRYRFGVEFDGFADTVHRFRGSQRPIVVVDTVAGAGDKPGYFYEGSGLSSQTCRLLNVMLSRAEDHLLSLRTLIF